MTTAGVTAIEIHTLWATGVVLLAICAVAWWLIGRVARLSPTAAWLLMGFNLAGSAALLLRGLRGPWLDALTCWPADVLALVSVALLRAAIPGIDRRDLAWRLPVLVVLVGALLLAAMPYQGDLRGHARVLSWGALALFVAAAHDAWSRLRETGAPVRRALAFTWPLGLLALVTAWLAISATLPLGGPAWQEQVPSWGRFVFLWILVVAVVLENLTFGFLVLLRLVLRIRELAEHDALTGVFNRLAFEVWMHRAFRAFQRGQPFALIMLDMDRFKRLNDALGHAAGDAALAHLVNAVQPCLREVDKLGRLGGEEFAVLLPDTDLAGAALVAERMRELVAGSGFEWLGVAWPLSASFGVAQPRADDLSAEAVLARADAGLYQAKAQGRNVVQAAD